jgi:hypothetical protein
MATFSEIEDAFLFVSSSPPFEHSAYLNKETGEIYYASEVGGDFDELPGDLEESDKYVSIPHKNDLDLGRDLVFAFVSANLPDEYGKVRGFFSGRGAYARYKDLLESKGRLEAWYEFEKQAIEEALRKWCTENNIVLAG